MERSDIIRISVNDMEAVYGIDENGNVSFMIIPAKDGEKQGDEPQPDKLKPDMLKSGKIYPDKIHSDPLVQISCSGDASCIGFCAGETRHNSALTMSFKYISQEITEENGEKKIITTVRSDAGITARHVLVHSNSGRAVRVFTEVSNESESPVTIEALSSVNISGLTPYTNDEERGRLKLHRFRSRWSEEGRHEVRSAEELLLEPSWADFGVRCEKFGCLGSMPVRGYFPFVAVEDEKEGVF